MKRQLQTHAITGSQLIADTCLVCGKDNPVGYHAQFLNLDDGRALALFVPDPNLQSYPDRLHGGVSSALMDELLSRSIQVKEPKQLSVTLELNLKFRAPVPTGQQIRAVSWVVKDRSKVYDAAGEVLLDDGTVAVEAQGRFYKISLADVGGTDATRTYFFEDDRPYPATIEA